MLENVGFLKFPDGWFRNYAFCLRGGGGCNWGGGGGGGGGGGDDGAAPSLIGGCRDPGEMVILVACRDLHFMR